MADTLLQFPFPADDTLFQLLQSFAQSDCTLPELGFETDFDESVLGNLVRALAEEAQPDDALAAEPLASLCRKQNVEALGYSGPAFLEDPSTLSTILQSPMAACCSESSRCCSKSQSPLSSSEADEAEASSLSSEDVPAISLRSGRRPLGRCSPYGDARAARRSARKPSTENAFARSHDAESAFDLVPQARLVICDSCNHRCVQRQDPASFVWFRDLVEKDQDHLLGLPHCQVCGGDLAAMPVRMRGYMCHLCDRTFRSSDRLIAHAAKHNGRKAFSCSDCGKSFSRQPRLIVHQQRFGHFQAAAESD